MAKQKRNAYRLTLKVKVIKFAEIKGINSASSRFDIDRKSIRLWLRNKADIMAQASSRSRRRCQRVRKSKWPNMEQDLHGWIMEMREQGRCVSGKMVKHQAAQICGDLAFRASNGWLSNFLSRKNLVRRRITTSGTLILKVLKITSVNKSYKSELFFKVAICPLMPNNSQETS